MRFDTEMTRTAGLLGLGFALTLVAATAGAQPTPYYPDQWTLAYDGFLLVGGERATGDAALRFTLYDPDGTALWSEEWSDGDTRSCSGDEDCRVALVDGRFSVQLGRWVGIADTIRDADPLSLGIAVRSADGAWVDLDNRQRLAAVPWTQRSDRATNLVVRGALTAQGDVVARALVEAASLATAGDLLADGTLTVSSLSTESTLTVSGDATVTGDISAGYRLLVGGAALRFGSGSGNGDGGRALLRTGDGVLYVNPDGDFSGGIHVAGDVTADTLDVEYFLTIGGSASFNGNWTWSENSGQVQLDYANSGTDQTASMDSGYGFCWVAGWRFLSGDIDEGGTEDIMRAYVYNDGSGWKTRGDFVSHGTHETHEVAAVCVRSGLIQIDSYFTD